MIHLVTLCDPESGKSVDASIVCVYSREEMPVQTDAPTIRNQALAVFSAVPEATRVAVAVTERTVVLFLVEAAHAWFDVRGKRVTLRSREKGENGRL